MHILQGVYTYTHQRLIFNTVQLVKFINVSLCTIWTLSELHQGKPDKKEVLT